MKDVWKVLKIITKSIFHNCFFLFLFSFLLKDTVLKDVWKISKKEIHNFFEQICLKKSFKKLLCKLQRLLSDNCKSNELIQIDQNIYTHSHILYMYIGSRAKGDPV